MIAALQAGGRGEAEMRALLGQWRVWNYARVAFGVSAGLVGMWAAGVGA